MKFAQIGAIIFLCTVEAALGDFTCYHGEGTGKNYIPKNCPSGICIIFNSACGGYTSTTCYSEKTPMAIIRSFKKAIFYYKTSPQSCSFGYCLSSECNKGMDSLANPVIINSDPSSFDHLLSKKIKKETMNKKLKNGIKLPNGIQSGETFEFVGKTSTSSKSAWIAFTVQFNNGTTARLQYTMGLIKKTLGLKTSVSRSSKQKALTWAQPVKRGDVATITLKNKPGFEFAINGAVIGNMLDSTIKNIDLVTYGGNWALTETSIIASSGSKTPLQMLPTFYSTLVPLMAAKIKGNSDTLKLIVNEDGGWYGKEHMITISSVFPNEMRSYEFRASDNPQSDLVKFQFQSMPVPPVREYVTLWKRVNNVWSTTGTVLSGGSQICDYRIGIDLDGINVYCNRQKIHNITYPNIANVYIKRYQNDAAQIPCSKTDPYHRLLGMMPRITEYSF